MIKPITYVPMIPYDSDCTYHWHNKSKIQVIDLTNIQLDHIKKPNHKVHFLLNFHILYVNDENTKVSYLLEKDGKWYPFFDIRFNEIITKIKCSGETIFVLTQSGILYSCKYRCPNCLTPHEYFDDITKIFFKNVIKFNCSTSHIIILTSDNKIHGLELSRYRHLCSRCRWYDESIPIEYILPDGTEIIPKKISCGTDYMIILTTLNKLYSCGNNHHGQLGLGDYQRRDTFQQIPFVFPRIKSIHCGSYHTIIITVCNEIYVWGDTRYGQLGLGDNKNRNSPCPLLAKADKGSSNALALEGQLDFNF